MRAVLYNPVSSASRKPVLPMSLLALGAILEGKHEYLIVDGNLERDPLAALDGAVRAISAGVLGVTVMPGPQLCDAVPICRAMKALHPDLLIIWGGYFPSEHPDVCLRSGFVDFVVRGHGEIAFARLLDGIASGERPHRGMSGPEPPADPDLLPDFPYERVDVPRYARKTFMGARTLAHHSSYGCPFRCNFCGVVGMAGGRWLAQSAARTAAVTRRLVSEWGADGVEFYDNNFFVHEARTSEFCERIEDLGVSWWGEARIDTLTHYADRTWERMRSSGLKMVFMGAESGSDATLARMNKGGTATTEQTLAIASRMKRYGIIPEFSFVLGNPPDAEEDVRRTIEFIREVKGRNEAAEIILYTYTPVPLAGALYDEARSCGFRFPETLEEWVSPGWVEFSRRRSVRMPWLGDPLRRRIRDFESVLAAYFPTATDSRLRGGLRWLLRAMGAWRYHFRLYGRPIELKAMQRLIRYRRPETSGF